MHPAAWIAWATCAGLVTFSTTNPFYLGIVIGASWLVYVCHRRPDAAHSFRIFLIVAIVTVALRVALALILTPLAQLMHAIFDRYVVPVQTVTGPFLIGQALQGARLGTLLLVFGVFNAVCDPYAILRMAPRHFHEPALAASLALSIAPRTIDAVGVVREGQTLRGLRPKGFRMISAFAIPILETGMEDAVTLAESMDARGHGFGTRTRYRTQAWTIAATWMVLAAAVSMIVFWSIKFAEGSMSLDPITDPLTLPEVDPRLVIAAALLAVPALVPRDAS